MIARAYRSQVPLHERTIVNEWKTIEEDIAEPHRDASTARHPQDVGGPLDWTL